MGTSCRTGMRRNSMTQAEFLKKIRSYFDDTQKEFAQRIGVSTILISMIESGQKSISKKLIVKIANELNVDPAYLSPSLMDEFPIYAFSERMRTILKNIKRKYPLPETGIYHTSGDLEIEEEKVEVIVNPVTGKLENHSEENAWVTARAFLREVHGHEAERNECIDSDDGWYGFNIDGVEVKIPGIDPEIVQKSKPWVSPRLYVEGCSCWLWEYALGLFKTYVIIKHGVTMGEIAEKFGVDVEDLKIKKEG